MIPGGGSGIPATGIRPHVRRRTTLKILRRTCFFLTLLLLPLYFRKLLSMQSFQSAISLYWSQHPEYAAEARACGFNPDSGRLPVRGIMFDMDGVLFDSMPYHAKAWSSAAHAYGLRMTEEEVYMNEGRTGHSTINWLTRRQWDRDTTPEEVEHLYSLKSQAFNAFPEAPKMPGAEALLQQVKASGRMICVVTGSGQASLLGRLSGNFPGIFQEDRIVSSRDVEHGKPHPEPYLKGLGKMRLRPWEAIVVENAPLGVRAGVAAGVFTIAANTGPLADDVLADEGAAMVMPSMTALSEAWSRWEPLLQWD